MSLKTRMRSFLGLFTKDDSELRIGACIVGALLAIAIVSPVSCWMDWKDTHRPVDYIRYNATQPAPLVGLALSAYNLEGYLHETWNRYSRDPSATRWVAAEFHWFIEKNDYNERKLANEGGSDWTRPYLGIFEKAIVPARDKLYAVAGPVSKIDLAGDRISASWRHTTYRQTHSVSYSCGTSKQPRTCTRTVCDWVDHTFTLDHRGLQNGLEAAIDGWGEFPDLEKEPLGSFVRPASEGRKLPEGQFDSWRNSPLVAGYDEFWRDVDAGRGADAEKSMAGAIGTYPARHTDRNYGCGGPQSYPRGWRDHESVLGSIRSTVGVYVQIRSSVTDLENAAKAIRGAVKEIESGRGREGMRAMADLAWTVHNRNNKDHRFSYASVTWILRLVWLLTAALLSGLAWAIVSAYKHKEFIRKIYSFGETTTKPWRGRG